MDRVENIKIIAKKYMMIEKKILEKNWMSWKLRKGGSLYIWLQMIMET